MPGTGLAQSLTEVTIWRSAPNPLAGRTNTSCHVSIVASKSTTSKPRRLELGDRLVHVGDEDRRVVEPFAVLVEEAGEVAVADRCEQLDLDAGREFELHRAQAELEVVAAADQLAAEDIAVQFGGTGEVADGDADVVELLDVNHSSTPSELTRRRSVRLPSVPPAAKILPNV